MNINLNVPINNVSYGLVSQNILSALIDDGHDVALFPINPPNSMQFDRRIAGKIDQSLKRSVFYDYESPTLKVWHQWDYTIMPGRGSRIGFPIFELDRMTPLEKHHLNSLDIVYVCSKWAWKVLYDSEITANIKVAPLGVDQTIFFPATPIKNRKTIFLNIGKWEKRKSHDKIVDYFNKTFTDKDEVELWMSCDNPFCSQEQTKEWHKLYKDSKLGDKIKLIPMQPDQFGIANLMRKASFGLFTSRAEGWNLPLSEMMVTGRPSIVTNYSAHTEFCSSDTSLLVEVDETEPADDGIWFKPGQSPVNQGNWAKLGKNQEEQAVTLLRRAHDMYQNRFDEYVEMCNRNINKGKELTWQNCVKNLNFYL